MFQLILRWPGGVDAQSLCLNHLVSCSCFTLPSSCHLPTPQKHRKAFQKTMAWSRVGWGVGVGEWLSNPKRLTFFHPTASCCFPGEKAGSFMPRWACLPTALPYAPRENFAHRCGCPLHYVGGETTPWAVCPTRIWCVSLEYRSAFWWIGWSRPEAKGPWFQPIPSSLLACSKLRPNGPERDIHSRWSNGASPYIFFFFCTPILQKSAA